MTLQYRRNDGTSIGVPILQGVPKSIFKKFRTDGYIPASGKQILEQRIREPEEDIEHYSWNNHANGFILGNSIIYHPDGHAKIIPSKETLRFVPSSEIVSCQYHRVPEGTFDEVEGDEFTKEELAKYGSQRGSVEDLVSNPIYLSIFDNEKDLIRELASLRNKRWEKTRALFIKSFGDRCNYDFHRMHIGLTPINCFGEEEKWADFESIALLNWSDTTKHSELCQQSNIHFSDYNYVVGLGFANEINKSMSDMESMIPPKIKEEFRSQLRKNQEGILDHQYNMLRIELERRGLLDPKIDEIIRDCQIHPF